MTLAALVAVSGLFQIAVTMRLSLLRRIVTPAVSGTFMMLIAITVFSVAFGAMTDVPAGSSAAAAPLCALATLAVTLGILLRGPAVWRLWAPIIGIGAGCATAGAFGIYELEILGDAAWFGLPASSLYAVAEEAHLTLAPEDEDGNVGDGTAVAGARR